jgi:chemotaxis protein MotB
VPAGRTRRPGPRDGAVATTGSRRTSVARSQFASNWELSTARATRVVEFFVAGGIATRRLSAAGYSEFHPRVPNTTPEARAMNRRVDLVILNLATSRTEEPGARASR